MSPFNPYLSGAMTKCLIIILLSILCIVNSTLAQMHGYEIGDTYYRYEALLDDSVSLFSNINIHEQFYACVDVLHIEESTLSQADFQLASQNDYAEYMSYKEGVLNMAGLLSNDPFLSVPHMSIQFFSSIPIVNSMDTEQFKSKGTSDFFLVYKSKHWTNDLRIWASQNDVKEIRIMAAIIWDNKYIGTDEYKDIYMNIVEGNVVEYNHKYIVKKIEIKKEQWEEVNIDDMGYLKSLFSDKHEKYFCIYDYNSVVETARLNVKPYYSFVVQTNNAIGEYPDCSHGANEIYVFPNPTFDDVKIRVENSTYDYYTFSVFNIIGKKLWTKRIDITSSMNETYIDLPPIEKGVYIYGIDTPSGKRIKSRKLLVMDL